MKRLLTILLLFISIVSLAQTKSYIVEAVNILKAGNNFVWKGDTIRKDSIVYVDIKNDSIRFKKINGTWTNFYHVIDARKYRLLNNHDSLSHLDEKLYSSLDGLPDLTLKVDKIAGKALSDNNFTDSDSIKLVTYQDSLNAKVQKITGKGLSTNDYTTAEKNKLSGIAENAEVNVNADWNANTGDAQILNKPTIPDISIKKNISDTTDIAGYTRRDRLATELAKKLNYRTFGSAANSAATDFEPANNNIQTHISNTTTNPHNVTKSQVGLGNVDNTSDADKPVSTATQTELNKKINSTEKGSNLGVATLDGGGKVPMSQLPSSLMIYLGFWNPSTNDPALADGTGVNGWVYKANTTGTINLGSGAKTWNKDDYAIYNGEVWEYSSATDKILSVNGQTGAVILNTDNINEGTTNKYYTDSRARGALSLTTSGNSGAATYSNGAFNIPNYTLSGLGGEPAFAKNTAFNKDFGTGAGTVLEGRTFGSAANNNTGDFEVPLTFSTGLTRNSNTVTHATMGIGSGFFRSLPKGQVFTSFGYDIYGHMSLVPVARDIVAGDIPSLDWSKIVTGKPTTLSGYGITDTPWTGYLPLSGGTLTGDLITNLSNNAGYWQGKNSGTNKFIIGDDSQITGGSTDDLTLYTYSGDIKLWVGGLRGTFSHTGLSIDGTVTATGGNSTQWNSAYTHSQTNHVKFNTGYTGSTSDLNNLWESGFYSLYQSTNVPFAGDGGVLVMPTWNSTSSSSRYTLQIASPIGHPEETYIRGTDINGSGAWYKLWNGANFNPDSKQNTITGLTTNYLPKWNGSSLVNSLIDDNGSTSSFYGAVDITQNNLRVSGSIISGWNPNYMGGFKTYAGESPVSVRQTFGTDDSGWQYRLAKNNNGTITDLITVADNGFVGVGYTSDPTSGNKLAVNGNGYFGGSVTTTGDLTLFGAVNNANHTISCGTNTAWYYYLATDGNDFRIYDADNTDFIRLKYNSGGTTKSVSLFGAVTATSAGNTTFNGTGASPIVKINRDFGTNGSLEFSFPSTEGSINSTVSDLVLYRAGSEKGRFNSTGLSITGNLTTTGSGTFAGGGFNSSRKLKDLYPDWNKSALEAINQFKLRDFSYKTDSGKNRTLGFIIDEIPNSVKKYVVREGEAVNTYTLHGLSFKAHQEESQRITELEKGQIFTKDKLMTISDSFKKEQENNELIEKLESMISFLMTDKLEIFKSKKQQRLYKKLVKELVR